MVHVVGILFLDRGGPGVLPDPESAPSALLLLGHIMFLGSEKCLRGTFAKPLLVQCRVSNNRMKKEAGERGGRVLASDLTVS